MTITKINDAAQYVDSAGRTESADVVIVAQAAPYSLGGTALIAGSGNVANASAVATLTGGALTTVYLAGFEVTGLGATTAVAVACTVSGLLGGSRVYNVPIPAGVLVGITPLVVAFNPPLPASAVNTPIAVTVGAAGAGNTNMAVVAHGFHQ